MSSRSSKQPSNSRRHSVSSVSKTKTKTKTKTKPQTDNWAEVTSPEERRRIQNRIAQRKFREKARERREQARRERENQENALNTYRVPGPGDLDRGEDVSGLPWGSFSMQYIVARGHESASRQGSRHASDQQRSPEMQQQFTDPYGDGCGQVASFDARDSSGDDAAVYDESPCFYDYELAAPVDGHGYGPTYEFTQAPGL